MSGEAYLHYAYFLALAACLLTGVFALRALSGEFLALARGLLTDGFARRLHHVFKTTIWMFVIAGFASVSMTSCQVDTYDKVIEDSAYIEARTRSKVAASAQWLVNGLMVWALAPTVLILARHRNRSTPGD